MDEKIQVWPDGMALEEYHLQKVFPHFQVSIGQTSTLRPGALWGYEAMDSSLGRAAGI